MGKLDKMTQKSLWLTLRTRRRYESLARKESRTRQRRVTSAELMRQALVEWLEKAK